MRKTLDKMPLLEGQVETITVCDLRSRPGDVMAQVQMGKTYNITKNGRLIAVLSKPEPTAFELGSAARRMRLV